MLLTIGTETPDWWIGRNQNNEFYSVKTWWDGLEWQDYQVPDFSCSNLNMFNEVVCYADTGAYMVSDTFQVEWLYKMIANVGGVIRNGIDLEIGNVVDIFMQVIICLPF